jgi:hypothetical protein
MEPSMLNPFGKPFSEITTTLLETLLGVEEGWYFEFKREIPDPKSIAKSVSAFANQYGGWLLYGAIEKPGQSRVLGSIPGIATVDADRALDRIRDASIAHISPTLYFETCRLDGPMDAVGLASDRSLIVVRVPQGLSAPYVHSTGVVYRRAADSSNPVAERDRYALDELWRRSDRARDLLTERLSRTPTLSEAESDAPFCHIFFAPDAADEVDRWQELTFDRFRSVLQARDTEGFSIPFDNFFASSEGWVARLVTDNNPSLRLLTWEQSLDGWAFVSLPLSLPSPMGVSQYHLVHKFAELTRTVPYKRILDLNVVCLALITIVAVYRRLRALIQGQARTVCKLRFENIWHIIPFLDWNAYLSFIETNGPPIVQYSTVWAPPRKSFDTMERLNLDDMDVEQPETLHEIANQILHAIPILVEVLHTFGIPANILIEGELSNFMVAVLNRASFPIKKGKPE